MTALITGVSGCLGRVLVEEVRLSEEKIVGVRLSKNPIVLPGLEHCWSQDVRTAQWEEILQNVDVVFHLAAAVHRANEQARAALWFDEVNREATARLARACRLVGAKLILASTVAVYGESADVVTDQVIRKPTSPYGASKSAGEDAVFAEGAKGLRFSVLRFPLLFGPHGRGNVERMLRAIAARRYWPLGDPATPKSCLYVTDAARALVVASKSESAIGRAMIVSPRITPTLGEIHRAAYDALERWLPPHLPTAPAKSIAQMIDRVAGVLGRPPILFEGIRSLTRPTKFDGAEFRKSTGFLETTSLRQGIGNTVDWMLGGERDS